MTVALVPALPADHDNHDDRFDLEQPQLWSAAARRHADALKLAEVRVAQRREEAAVVSSRWTPADFRRMLTSLSDVRLPPRADRATLLELYKQLLVEMDGIGDLVAAAREDRDRDVILAGELNDLLEAADEATRAERRLTSEKSGEELAIALLGHLDEHLIAQLAGGYAARVLAQAVVVADIREAAHAELERAAAAMIRLPGMAEASQAPGVIRRAGSSLRAIAAGKFARLVMNALDLDELRVNPDEMRATPYEA
ncbi:hypothetical protein [Streptosporangium sp. NPDC002524]|uniref:hypothetical protein n=1 Tax=Streptosporangium sp. NPDC002524 TaxID=3154537 RepID=UPI003329E4DB